MAIKRIRPWAKAAMFAPIAALALPAMAQDVREEVTVTARKQEESLQQVPVTVTAIAGQQIERFQYDKIADIAARVPTLNVQTGGSGSGAQVTLRGVGSSNISAAFDSAVAFDFDGMQVSTMRILQSAFFDVRQIEVLKGPQSLFFGKSASAGVISIKSANPTEEFEFGGKAAYEIEEKGYVLEAFASGPITDQLGFRIAARFEDISEVYFNSAPVVDPKNGEENFNVRGTLDYKGDSFRANLKLNYVRHENDSAHRTVYVDCSANGRADEIIILGGLLIDPGYPCDRGKNEFFLPDGAAPLSIQAEQQDVNGGVPYGESDIFFGVLNMDFDITDEITLTSVTGYLDQDAQDSAFNSYGGVLNGASYGLGNALTDHQLEQFTQEFRVTTSFDGPINLMLGVFYEDRHSEFNTNQQAVNISIVSADPVTGNSTDWYKRHIYEMEALSIFGQFIWDLTDTIELSGGVRWTDEKKDNTILVPFVHSFLSSGPAFIASGFDSGIIPFRDDNLSPEVTLSWQATEDLNLYVAYKTGFKSGGIDNSALPSANLLGFGSADPAVVQATRDGLIYRSETAEGVEVGVKSQWLDRALTINASVYYFVFDDLQVQNFDSVAIQFQTTNASELTTKGVDIDFNWYTGIEGLTVFGALAYTSAKFTAPFDPIPNNGIDESIQGRSVGRAPEWAGNIGGDMRVPVGNSFELGITGNVAFSSSYFINEDSFDDDRQSSFATFDLAVSLGDPDGSWQFAIIGTNLGNKMYKTTGGPRPFLLGPGNAFGLPAGDDQVINVARGRQVFIEASFKY